jgi:hypothetical protein
MQESSGKAIANPVKSKGDEPLIPWDSKGMRPYRSVWDESGDKIHGSDKERPDNLKKGKNKPKGRKKGEEDSTEEKSDENPFFVAENPVCHPKGMVRWL